MAALTEIKRVKNAILYHDKDGQPYVRLDNVRLSYCFVGTPGEDENEDGSKSKSWRSDFLLPKDTHLEAKNLMKEAILGLIPKDVKVPVANWCLMDGDEKAKNGDDPANGNWIVRAKDAKIRPRCRNRKGEVMDDIDEIDKVFYSGAWAHVMVRPWYFGGTVKGKAKTFPRRVPAGLSSLFFAKDDKPFGSGRIDDSDAWNDVPKNDSVANGMDDDDSGDL